jgi:Sulfatase-modifying factor enzyme 1
MPEPGGARDRQRPLPCLTSGPQRASKRHRAAPSEHRAIGARDRRRCKIPLLVSTLAQLRLLRIWIGCDFRIPPPRAAPRTAPGRYPRFWFGTDEKELCRYGNAADQKARETVEETRVWEVAPCNDGYAYTSPAGHFPANDFGLHDMFGNAAQATADCYHDSYTAAPSDGSAWTTGDCSQRVLRGGAWNSGGWGVLRAAFRARAAPEFRYNNLGFR